MRGLVVTTAELQAQLAAMAAYIVKNGKHLERFRRGLKEAEATLLILEQTQQVAIDGITAVARKLQQVIAERN
jgi:hypothetical protein